MQHMHTHIWSKVLNVNTIGHIILLVVHIVGAWILLSAGIRVYLDNPYHKIDIEFENLKVADVNDVAQSRYVLCARFFVTSTERSCSLDFKSCLHRSCG